VLAIATATSNRTIDLNYVTRAITVAAAAGATVVFYDAGNNARNVLLTAAGVYRFEIKCIKFGFTNAAAAGAVVEMTNIPSTAFVGKTYAEIEV
jgi:hypothetical protein